MILTLRLISQICQCFEDRGIDEAESEKNGLPLYLRQGSDEQIDRKEYLLKLSTMISRRGSQSKLERLDTTDTKRILNETKNIFQQTGSNFDDQPKGDKKGEVNPGDLYSFPTEQQQLRGFDTGEGRKKSGNTNEADDYSPLKRERNSNNILRIEDNQEEAIQAIDEIQLDKQSQDEDDEQFDPHAINHIKKTKKTEHTLEERVKKLKKKVQRKKKKQPIQKSISPYRVNLPSDLAHLKQ